MSIMSNVTKLPNVGQTVLVNKRSTGLGSLESGKDKEVRTIQHVFQGGAILDHVGDLWSVVPCHNNLANWFAVA